jgi:hypothetical protein
MHICRGFVGFAAVNLAGRRTDEDVQVEVK